MNMNTRRENSYGPDGRAIIVRVRRAGSVGNQHVPHLEIRADAEWQDDASRLRNLSLDEIGAEFDRDATLIAEALISVLPGGTLDRLVGKLLAYKASHFIVAYQPTAGERLAEVMDRLETIRGFFHEGTDNQATRGIDELLGRESATKRLGDELNAEYGPEK